MPKAIWNGAVLAESDKCEVVDPQTPYSYLKICYKAYNK